jgi:RNA polymerase sigma factor (sigma-70 family)
MGASIAPVIALDPFSTDEELAQERELVRAAQDGDKKAIEQLIKRHQPWIFNIALRMVADFHEAEDLTQDICIKWVSKLSTFQGRSEFRTWLYRIAVNHVLSMRKTKLELYQESDEPEKWADDEYMRRYIDWGFADCASVPPDLALVVEEIKIKCMLGMLLCLNRTQRIVYILGAIFGLGGKTVCELLDLSEANYRKILSRARARVWAFLGDRCSLINPAKPCTCELSAQANLRTGYVDAVRRVFNQAQAPRIRQIVQSAQTLLNSLRDRASRELYRDHPFITPPDISERIAALIESDEFRTIVEATTGPSSDRKPESPQLR